ncbi:MAG TPA: hypothetical protein VKY24_24015 [Reyranella sp.]|nr:hypothetical protein [Reyranella sp.]
MTTRRRKTKASDAVSVAELRDSILAMIAERFAGRELTIDTARMAPRQAAFDLTMAHVRAVAEEAAR